MIQYTHHTIEHDIIPEYSITQYQYSILNKIEYGQIGRLTNTYTDRNIDG